MCYGPSIELFLVGWRPVFIFVIALVATAVLDVTFVDGGGYRYGVGELSAGLIVCGVVLSNVRAESLQKRCRRIRAAWMLPSIGWVSADSGLVDDDILRRKSSADQRSNLLNE